MGTSDQRDVGETHIGDASSGNLELAQDPDQSSGPGPDDAGATDEPIVSGNDAGEDAVQVLPWYYSWWRVALVAIAATLLAVAGWIALTDDGQPDPESVDVGFLQDMRSHHDQAVLMSMIYLNRPDIDPGLYTMATEVLLSQQMEIGIFVEVLRSFGAAEENSTGVSMAWMDTPVPLDAMPGMASEESLEALKQSSGTAADQLFTELMIAHHEGGIHMAQYAADHAGQDRTRSIAEAVVRNQTSEIAELNAALERSLAG